MNLEQVADELTRRVISLFEKDADGNRKIYDSAQLVLSKTRE